MAGGRFCLAAGVLSMAAAFAAGAEAPGGGGEVLSSSGPETAGGSAAPAGGGMILLPLATGFVSGAAGPEKDEGAAALTSTAAAAGVIADSGPVIPVNQCFCLAPRTPAPADPMPYYIGRLTAVSPLCDKIELKLDGRPVLEQLLFCKELGECWGRTAQYAEKKRRLEKELSAARDKAAACCPGTKPAPPGKTPSGCDKSCGRRGEKEISRLAREVEEIESGGPASMEECVSAAIQKRGENAAGKNRAR